MATSTVGVTSEKQDLLHAIDFAMEFFNKRMQEGRLTPEQHQALAMYYKENRARVETGGPPSDEMTLPKRTACWSCRAAVDPRNPCCVECGAPSQGEAVDRLRYLVFVCYELKKHEKVGRIPLAVAHDLMAEGNERIAALRGKLDEQRAPLVQAVTAEPPAPPPAAVPVPVAQVTLPPPRAPRKRPSERPATVQPIEPAAPPAPRRSVIDILLDPRTIQWLLASGGALLVLGLVIWLAAEGLFENKLFVAVLLGVGNAALLGGGWALIHFTRYQIAGRAVTLLACLLMPLNLWFYDAQGLMPLKEGGHLWIPALVICALYAVSARLLKDPVFVPVLVAGVTMTGLLLLADQLFDKFWEITAPSTLLVVLGLVFIHAERLFPVSDGPFSRRRFGLTFFWSGHAVLAAGLLLLFFAQLFGGWLYPVVKPVYEHFGFTQPEVVTSFGGKWLALLLVLAGTYAYAYSDVVVRRIGVYIYIAVFTLLWAEVLFITIFAEFWTIPAAEVVAVALALTGLLANVVLVSMAKGQPALQRVGAPLALFLCGIPVLLGLVLHFQAMITRPPLLHHELHWSYVVAMAVTAGSCRIGAHLYRHERQVISTTYFFGTAAALMAGAAGILIVASDGKMPWHEQAPLLMVIPILYLIASRLYRGHTEERPLGWVAHAAAAVMLLSSLGAAFKGFALVSGEELNLLLAAFFAEAALFYGVAAVTREKSLNVYFATAAACAAVWQLLKHANSADEWYTLAFAVTGLVLLGLYRFAVLEKYGGDLAAAAFQCANAMLLLAFTAAALITGTELLLHADAVRQAITEPTSEKGPLVLMLLVMVLASLAAVVLVRHQGWRRFYVGAAAVNAAEAVLVLLLLGTLTPAQKLETAALVVGVLLLGAGYFGWYREQERHDDLTTLELFFGSLLVAVPVAITVVSGRWTKSLDTFHWLNEVGMLALGLLLLAAGYACRLKAPTLAGAFMMAVYLLSLVLFLRIPERLQTTALYIMIGGGVFFATGLVLAVYRDRLRTLPERIKRREGVFRVLAWR
jgi:hypothetical protein